MQNIHSQNSSFSSKYKCIPKCLTKCFNKSKKKNPKILNESEIKTILRDNQNLLKLDNSKINNQQSIISPFRKRIKERTELLRNPGKIRYQNISENIITPIKPDRDEKHFFHEFKDKIRCFCCGGKNCKHENYKNNINNNNAIEGLNSNFITDNIIASQRPSQILIQQYHLNQKFKILNIGLIVNLQREGEHPYCGPNAYHLTSAGYSYNPSVFTGDDIKCKFSGWKDMEIPSSMNFMLDIVKEMSIVTNDEKSKVLVHCHAGYGRTGVVIVCYLLFNSTEDSDTIIKKVREKRKKCVETKSQVSYCKKFEDFLNHSRILFGDKESIDVYLRRQEDLLYGNELFKYGFVPKIIIKVLDKIMDLMEKYNYNKITIYKIIEGIIIDWNEESEIILLNMKSLINKGDWESFDKNDNLIVVVELLFDWFEDCVEFIISRERTEKIISSDLYTDFIFNLLEKKNKKFTNIQLSKQRKNLFDYIKRIYHCFEYEIIFSFATFLITLQPNSEEENNLFNSVIDRISIGLLGFSYNDANNNDEYNKSIYFLYSGLSSIIKLICESIFQNTEKENLSIVSPVRKNCPVKYNLTKKDKIPFVLTLDNLTINDRRKSYMLQRALNTMLSNPRISLNSSNFYSSLPKNKTLIKENNYENMYKILNKHYSSKNLFEEPEVPSFYLNSPSEVPSYPEDYKKNKNLFSDKKDLGQVLEEVNSKNSNSFNSGLNDKNNCNISNMSLNWKNDSKEILNSNNKPNNQNKVIFKDKINKKKKKEEKEKKESLKTTTSDNRKSLVNLLFEKNEKNFNYKLGEINNNHSLKMRNTMLNIKTDNQLYENIISNTKDINDFNVSVNKKKNNINDNNNDNEKIIKLIKC